MSNTYKSDAPDEDVKDRRQKPKKEAFTGNIDQVDAHFKKDAQQVDEDGFEIVGGGNDRKARRQQAAARAKADDSDDFKIVRNEGKRNNAFSAMNN